MGWQGQLFAELLHEVNLLCHNGVAQVAVYAAVLEDELDVILSGLLCLDVLRAGFVPFSCWNERTFCRKADLALKPRYHPSTNHKDWHFLQITILI